MSYSTDIEAGCPSPLECSNGSTGKRPSGFTVPELLAVVAIIAIIISMLLPSLISAKKTAITAKCVSDKRQIVLGLHSYANDNRSAFPSRNPTTGYGYPHQMRRTSNGVYDLNKPFITPYLGDREVLSCPGLPKILGGLSLDWVTSQYHVFPKDVYWMVPRPELGKKNAITGRAPLWSCYARIKGGLYDSHAHSALSAKPAGMISAFSDGAAEWVPWEKTEGYWQAGEVHYWPIYR